MVVSTGYPAICQAREPIDVLVSSRKSSPEIQDLVHPANFVLKTVKFTEWSSSTAPFFVYCMKQISFRQSFQAADRCGFPIDFLSGCVTGQHAIMNQLREASNDDQA